MGAWSQYKARQVFTFNVAGKVISIFLLAVPLIFLGGYFYKRFAKVSWKTALFKTYTVLNDAPGADAVGEDNPWAVLVLNCVFIVGLFTFAVLLGIVCDDISSIVEETRSGKYTIVEGSHTVILGWNSLTLPLLRQMAIAQKERATAFKKPVVILANLDKNDMDQAVSQGVERDLYVVTRNGKPYQLSELEGVSAGKAQTIILLEGDDGLNDVTAATALVGIEACGGGPQRGQTIVLQTCSEEQTEGVILGNRANGLQRSRRGAVVQMHQLKRVQELMAQCAVQPGLSGVYQSLLQQSKGTPELYLKQFPQIENEPWSKVRRRFKNAILCGFIDNDTQQMSLNPADDVVLKKSYQLVALAQDDSQFEIGKEMVVEAVALQEQMESKTKCKDIVVLSFGGLPTGLLEGLTEFTMKGSHITIICSEAPEVKLPNKIEGCRVKLVQDNPESMEVLKAHNVAGYDTVVLTGEDLADEEGDGDAQVVSTVIQLRYLSEEHGRSKAPLHVVAAIHNHRTQELIDQVICQGAPGSRPKMKAKGVGFTSDLMSVDLLQPQALNSGLMTQVAAQPELIRVIDDFFHAGEVDVFLRDPEEFGLSHWQKLSWSQVQEAVRQSGETALGYLRDQEVEMSPGMSDSYTVLQEDKIVVLAGQGEA